LYAPLDGEVIEANQAVADSPETINADPYGAGWLVKLRVVSPPALLSPDEYRALIGE
jgi:glycine cleavage system H protein